MHLYGLSFCDDLKKLIKMKHYKINNDEVRILDKIKKKKECVIIHLVNDIIKGFKIYFMNKINYQIKKDKYDQKFKPKNLKFKDYDYDGSFKEDELDGEEELDNKKLMKK